MTDVQAETPTKAAKRIKCSCYQPYQDKHYGVKVRVHAKTLKGGWRCTGCGNVKDK